MKTKLSNFLMFIFTFFLVLGSFSLPTHAAEKETIKMATLALSSEMNDWIKEDMDKLGYNLEIVTFSENQQPAVALMNDDVDCFIVNQLVWLEDFNKSNGADLLMLEPYIYYPVFAAYSTKHDDINDLPENAKIAIPGNPVNIERALKTLEHAGVITLGEKLGDTYTLIDIEENPKNVSFIEMEQVKVVSSINDVDLIICTSTQVKEAGYDARDYLVEDPEADTYPIGLVVQPKDKDAEWAKEIINICRSDNFRKKFDDFFQGTRTLFPVE